MTKAMSVDELVRICRVRSYKTRLQVDQRYFDAAASQLIAMKGALEEARVVAEAVMSASMSSCSPHRGESSIGWQKGDGADSSTARTAARSAIAKIDALLNTSGGIGNEG